jgi:hypothetical protein
VFSVKSRVSLSADKADAIAISAASEGKLFFGRKNSMSSWPGCEMSNQIWKLAEIDGLVGAAR